MPLTLAALTLLISGCLPADAPRYPSLLPRPIESRDNREPVPPPPAVAKADPALDARLASLSNSLSETNKAFTAAADRATTAARTAQGDAVGGERWIAAQTALAELDGYRATLSAALTDIDELAISRAANSEPDYPGVAPLRESVQAALDAETAKIRDIQASLPAA